MSKKIQKVEAGQSWKEKCCDHVVTVTEVDDEFGESQFAKVREVERKIGKNVFTSKGGQQRNNPDQLCLICQI